jgi:hypothetical protein
VKQGLSIVLAVISVAGAGYIFVHRQELGFSGPRAGESPGLSTHPAAIVWQKVDRAPEGFRIEMPSGVKEIQVPAYNESSETEVVKMIFAKADAETTFSVAWEDNPPVARVNHLAPDRTLDMAETGAMTGTQTDPVNESENSPQGFPGRDFEARNSGGGVMNSRLIFTGSRLYMLVAAFPSATARRDSDVTRFFNSFMILSDASPSQAETGAQPRIN